MTGIVTYPARVRVVDCLGGSFSAHCRALSELVTADYAPDLVVAVREGGLHVAREMLAGSMDGLELVSVSSRRPGTSAKRRLNTALVLRRLPRFVTDRLRILEHHARVRLGARSQPPSVEIDDDTRSRIARSARILVVDDAVDSGTTLAAVVQHLSALGGAEIRTAVLAVTFPRPVILPDHALYRRGVLLRFPWSDDAGGRR